MATIEEFGLNRNIYDLALCKRGTKRYERSFMVEPDDIQTARKEAHTQIDKIFKQMEDNNETN